MHVNVAQSVEVGMSMLPVFICVLSVITLFSVFLPVFNI